MGAGGATAPVVGVPVPSPEVTPEFAGTPACPPMGSGHGKLSQSDPFSAPSIVLFQMSAGTPEP